MMMKQGLLLTFLSALLSVSAVAGEGEDFFEKQVRPLLVERCYKCHSGAKAGGGLSLESAKGWQRGGESGPALVPGKPGESLLVDAIHYRTLEMPPPEAGGKLSDEQIAVLEKWISMGAPDPRTDANKIGGMSLDVAATWWSFQPLPQVDAPGQPAAVDAFLQQKIEEHGLTVAAAADKRTLIRRATYDLTGLPPTPAEVAAFLADESPEAFAKVVDRLLESPQYGVHWGRHWLDVVRYADTAGENTDRPLPHAWRYRNWVLNSLNEDMPFDEFVRWQLCGDLIGREWESDKRNEAIVATGYLAIARRFGHDIDKDIHLMHEDVIDNLGKNMLGLTLGCARCHDHKYDPVSSEDYYALYGVFDSTRFAFPGCEPKGQPRDLVPLIDQSVLDARMAVYKEQLAAFEQQEKRIGEESQRLKQLATENSQVLAEANVPEGELASIHEGREATLDAVAMKRGDVLQLTVLPNGNYGADTTRIELEISNTGQPEKKWNVRDLIPRYAAEGPAFEDNGATWCLLDVTEGPQYLKDKKVDLNGQPSLDGWANVENPSSIVNASTDSVSVWTTLPPQTLFVHPGPDRNVAIAWVCPEDGAYQVHGLVADGHPAPGLDGVSFRLEHFGAKGFGEGLVALGELTTGSQKPKPEAPTFPVAYAVVEGPPHNVNMQLRGDPEQTGEEIPRSWLSAFGDEPLGNEENSGRDELADRVVSHPLFARVLANRIWQWHFGRGIVATPNDLGARGAAPTHPELLDWLAGQLVAHDFQLKPIHRLLMQTQAYQRGSLPVEEGGDPENHWLSHFSRRRLTAEEIRDSFLASSGELDVGMGERHPFPPESTWSFTQHNPFNAVYETNRRSCFLMVQRQRRHPYLALFDGADANASTPVRDSTTVPTQALYFMNAPFVHDRAGAFAGRVLGHSQELNTQLDFAYATLFQREPTAGERERALQFVERYPGEPTEKWAAFARVLMSSSEFLYVD
ncbi:MAG: PSD1 and planctomycete cytochrome C domain-containing protein [Planctomycetaceae bacterium]